MYIDIHTHDQHPAADVLCVASIYERFQRVHELATCSTGMHPWYLDDIETRWEDLQAVASLPNVIAIGECGLDKVAETDWPLQVDAFSRQIKLAQRLRKPLIIHCVRAYEEVTLLLKQHRVDVPVVFHGFNKSRQLADELLKHGYYLSFGAALLKDSPVAQTFRSVSADRFFLETDLSAQDIRHIYLAAAEIRQTSEEDLILQLQQNFKTAFNR